MRSVETYQTVFSGGLIPLESFKTANVSLNIARIYFSPVTNEAEIPGRIVGGTRRGNSSGAYAAE